MHVVGQAVASASLSLVSSSLVHTLTDFGVRCGSLGLVFVATIGGSEAFLLVVTNCVMYCGCFLVWVAHFVFVPQRARASWCAWRLLRSRSKGMRPRFLVVTVALKTGKLGISHFTSLSSISGGFANSRDVAPCSCSRAHRG